MTWPAVAKLDITSEELSGMPEGCKCGRAQSLRTGLWRLISTHGCPHHFPPDDPGPAPAAAVPGVSADVPGLAGVPEVIGPVPCPDCGQRNAAVHHVLAAAADACGACWHLWAGHGAGGCGAKVYPAHSLTGEPCPCERAEPQAAAGPDGDYVPRLLCGSCGAIFDLEATAYAAGLAAGVLAERARVARSAAGPRSDVQL